VYKSIEKTFRSPELNPDKELGIEPDTEIKRELGISRSATAEVTNI